MDDSAWYIVFRLSVCLHLFLVLFFTVVTDLSNVVGARFSWVKDPPSSGYTSDTKVVTSHVSHCLSIYIASIESF